jgi:hypothetical protein
LYDGAKLLLCTSYLQASGRSIRGKRYSINDRPEACE